MLGLDAAEGSGLIEVPARSTAAGCARSAAWRASARALSDTRQGLTAAQARDAVLAGGHVNAFYLLHNDPLREHPGSELWDNALRQAGFVVMHEQFLGEAASQHANVVFPAESYAEKEGTVTHPDGRLQRLRPAIGHPGEVRAEWQVLAEIAHRLGLDVRRSVTRRRGAAADRGGGSPLRRHHARRDRRPRSAVAGARRTARTPRALHSATCASARPRSRPLHCVRARARCASRPGPGLWASWVAEQSPSLRFLVSGQQVELSPLDAQRLGVESRRRGAGALERPRGRRGGTDPRTGKARYGT